MIAVILHRGVAPSAQPEPDWRPTADFDAEGSTTDSGFADLLAGVEGVLPPPAAPVPAISDPAEAAAPPAQTDCPVRSPGWAAFDFAARSGLADIPSLPLADTGGPEEPAPDRGPAAVAPTAGQGTPAGPVLAAPSAASTQFPPIEAAATVPGGGLDAPPIVAPAAPSQTGQANVPLRPDGVHSVESALLLRADATPPGQPPGLVPTSLPGVLPPRPSGQMTFMAVTRDRNFAVSPAPLRLLPDPNLADPDLPDAEFVEGPALPMTDDLPSIATSVGDAALSGMAGASGLGARPGDSLPPLPQNPLAGVAPGLPPQTLAGLAAAVTQAADNGTAAVELIMDPEELGPLRFELTRMGEQIHIHLTVDRADTLDLLRRHADQLLADLRASGFVGASLSFDSRSQGRGAAASSVVAPSATVSPPPPPVGPAPDSGLGLDLRL